MVSCARKRACRRSTIVSKRGSLFAGSPSPNVGAVVSESAAEVILGTKKNGLKTERLGLGVAVNQCTLGLLDEGGCMTDTWLPIVASGSGMLSSSGSPIMHNVFSRKMLNMAVASTLPALTYTVSVSQSNTNYSTLPITTVGHSKHYSTATQLWQYMKCIAWVANLL
jgi:hypothetical protein